MTTPFHPGQHVAIRAPGDDRFGYGRVARVADGVVTLTSGSRWCAESGDRLGFENAWECPWLEPWDATHERAAEGDALVAAQRERAEREAA